MFLFAALVVCVIILPAVCTALYHYVSYRKGWDADDLTYDADLESDSEGGVTKDGVQHYESMDGAEQIRRKERWRYYMHVMQAANLTVAATAGLNPTDDNEMISTIGTTADTAARF